jgi:hypothetical protein
MSRKGIPENDKFKKSTRGTEEVYVDHVDHEVSGTQITAWQKAKLISSYLFTPISIMLMGPSHRGPTQAPGNAGSHARENIIDSNASDTDARRNDVQKETHSPHKKAHCGIYCPTALLTRNQDAHAYCAVLRTPIAPPQTQHTCPGMAGDDDDDNLSTLTDGNTTITTSRSFMSGLYSDDQQRQQEERGFAEEKLYIDSRTSQKDFFTGISRGQVGAGGTALGQIREGTNPMLPQISAKHAKERVECIERGGCVSGAGTGTSPTLMMGHPLEESDGDSDFPDCGSEDESLSFVDCDDVVNVSQALLTLIHTVLRRYTVCAAQNPMHSQRDRGKAIA